MLLRMPTQPPPARVAIWRLLGWIAVLCGAVTLLTFLGRGALGIPSILDPAAWAGWASARDAVTIAFALMRAATLVLAWYLLGATVVGVVLRLAHRAHLVAVADVLTVPAVRRLLQSAFGIGLATAALTAGSAVATSPPTPDVAAASVPTDEQWVEMTPLPDDAAVMVPIPPAPPAPAPAAAAQTARQPEWTVRPGEHFWSIAEQVLRQHRHEEPGDDEVTAYWERLIEANRSRLVDQSNPDLIYPGQTLRLPAPDTR